MQQQNAANTAAAIPVDQAGGQAVTQTQPMILTPATQLVITQPPRNPKKYATKQSVVLGSIQICCGSLSIIFNIVIYVISPHFTVAHAATGIWTGIFFILAGTFGVVASKKKTKCMIVTFMVLSIFATVLGFALLIVSAIAWGTVDHPCNMCRSDATYECYNNCPVNYPRCFDNCEIIGNCTECWDPGFCSPTDCLNWDKYNECAQQCRAEEEDCRGKCEIDTFDEECGDPCGVTKALSAMNGLTLCASLVEIVVTIWSAVICCCVVCCCVSSSNNQAPRVIPVDAQTMQLLQQQAIYIHPGAPGVVMYHPQVANAQGLYHGTNPMPPPYQPADPNNPSGGNQAMAPPDGNNHTEQLRTKD